MEERLTLLAGTQGQAGVIDEFLRWYVRQAVLANMRGIVEPIFESEFPDGSDTVGEMLSGPRVAERIVYLLLTVILALLLVLGC
ncbi:hypothetical protein V1506DRAFT_335402 [Lipomyces tetrasporus]